MPATSRTLLPFTAIGFFGAVMVSPACFAEAEGPLRVHPGTPRNFAAPGGRMVSGPLERVRLL